MINRNKIDFSLSLTDKSIILFSWRGNKLEIIKEYEIQEILSSPEELVKEISTKKISLTIVPDYWIGMRFYPISSKRGSIVEAFLSRKLSVDFPELPDLKDFFEYSYQEKEGRQGIIVYFIQEELFYRIYREISSHLVIRKITCPAFLWQAKLSKQIKDINKGEKLIIHIYSENIYLCFFSKGLFLFSRTISMPLKEEYMAKLSYEIMQSLRLFSQKVKKEVEKIYIISENEEYRNKLQDFLEVEVEDISEKIALPSSSLELINKLGNIAFLDKSDITKKFLYFISTKEKNALKWAYFQNTGIITGILLFLMMFMEAIFLPKLLPVQQKRSLNSATISIEDYISAADELLEKKHSIDPSFLILKIMDSIPKSITIDEISINLESPIILKLHGIISASKIKELENLLSILLNNIKMNISNAVVPSMDDIDIKKIGDGRFEFGFQIEVNQEG